MGESFPGRLGALLQFNKRRRFAMYQEEVMVPIGDWAKTRLSRLSDTDKIRDVSRLEAALGKIFQTGLGEIKRIRQMFCISLRNVTIRIIAPLFQKNCRNGLLNCLPNRLILF